MGLGVYHARHCRRVRVCRHRQSGRAHTAAGKGNLRHQMSFIQLFSPCTAASAIDQRRWQDGFLRLDCDSCEINS